MLSLFVIAFLQGPSVLISWLLSPSAVILSLKISLSLLPLSPPSVYQVMGLDVMMFVLWSWVSSKLFSPLYILCCLTTKIVGGCPWWSGTHVALSFYLPLALLWKSLRFGLLGMSCLFSLLDPMLSVLQRRLHFPSQTWCQQSALTVWVSGPKSGFGNTSINHPFNVVMSTHLIIRPSFAPSLSLRCNWHHLYSGAVRTDHVLTMQPQRQTCSTTASSEFYLLIGKSSKIMTTTIITFMA